MKTSDAASRPEQTANKQKTTHNENRLAIIHLHQTARPSLDVPSGQILKPKKKGAADGIKADGPLQYTVAFGGKRKTTS